MNIVNSPTSLPGICFICRSPNRETFIDTGISLDFEGAVYICCECVRQFAQSYGYTTPDQSSKASFAVDKLEKANYELTKRVGALEESLRALADAGYGRDFTVHEPVTTTINTSGTSAMASGKKSTSKSLHDEDLGKLLTSVPSDTGSSFDL